MRFFLQCLVAFMAFNLTSPALADAGLPSTISAEIKGNCERTYKLLGPGRVLKCIRQKSEEYQREIARSLSPNNLPSTISAEIKGTCERTYELLGPGRVLKCIRQKSEEYIEEVGLQPSSPTQENGLAEDNANGNASNQRQLGQERVYGGKTEKN